MVSYHLQAGFADASHPTGLPLKKMKDVSLYSRNGVLVCQMFAMVCVKGVCDLFPTHEAAAKGIFFFSKVTAAGDEIGWDFISRVKSSRVSFTGFCDEMSRFYQTNIQHPISFMSPNTFISWIFGWLSAFKIDFREWVDPWCGYNPKYLACDGTHIGVAVRLQDNNNHLEKVDLPNQCLKPIHKRYDRVLIPDRVARLHLKFLCKKALKHVVDNLPEDELALQNQHVLDTIRNIDARLKDLLTAFVQCTLSENVHLALASFFTLFAVDAAMSTVLPFPCHTLLADIFECMSSGQCVERHFFALRHYCQELVDLLIVCEREGGVDLVISFCLGVIARLEEIHGQDRPTDPPIPIPNSYNPQSGVAYYFTRTGEQVRKLGRYAITGSARVNFDDPPQVDAVCTKDFPMVSRGGFGYMFLWFCPVHGHCYGMHLIQGAEGRKDPFTSLYKYLPEAPTEIFYDFACSLSEYSLNREPAFFKNTRISHDIFHSFDHICGLNFRSARVLGLEGCNSEICEQWNAYLQCIKYTASHLSQAHMMFFLQFFLYLKNQDKTKRFQEIVKVACEGCE